MASAEQNCGCGGDTCQLQWTPRMEKSISIAYAACFYSDNQEGAAHLASICKAVPESCKSVLINELRAWCRERKKNPKPPLQLVIALYEDATSASKRIAG